MTREEAVIVLGEIFDVHDEIHESSDGDDGYKEMTALRMAIEALQREEAEANGYCHRIKPKGGDDMRGGGDK